MAILLDGTGRPAGTHLRLEYYMPLDLLGALNNAASESGLGLNGVCNAIAGTQDLDALGALNVANGTVGLDMQGVIKQLVSKVSRINCITNPSVEVGTTGWGFGGAGTSVARITTDAYVGTACYQVTKAAVASSGATINLSSRVAVTGGFSYTASAWVKVPAANEDSGLRITVTAFNSGGTQVKSASSAVTTVKAADGWVRLSVTVKLPSTAASAYVAVLQPTAGTAGQKFLVDCVMLEKGATLNDYFDGATSGASWSGTANASSSSILSLNFSVS